MGQLIRLVCYINARSNRLKVFIMQKQFTQPLTEILIGLKTNSYSETAELYDDLSQIIEFVCSQGIACGYSIEELAIMLGLSNQLFNGMPTSSMQVLVWTACNQICSALIKSEAKRIPQKNTERGL